MFNLQEMHEKYPLLDYYSKFGQIDEERRQLTLTGLDEYKLIIRPLMILEILSSDEPDEAAAKKIAEGFQDTDFKFDALPKPENMKKNVEYLRGLLKKLDLEEVIRGYVAHDVTKCLAFVKENELAEGVPTASAHDQYLDAYLEKDLDLKNIFANKDNQLFINILDLLGHSPHKLQAPGPFASLQSVADIAIAVQKYSENVTVKGMDQEIATRDSIKTLLINSATGLSINYDGVKRIDPEVPFNTLDMKLQRELAFLMWTSGLRISNPDDLSAFQKAWTNPANKAVTDKMSIHLMNNLEQSPGYCALYNPTGMLHKTDKAGGLKAFLGTGEKGGMGASMEEVVTVAFPFILDICKDETRCESTLVGHNEFQVQQMIEMLKNTLPHLAGLTKNKNTYLRVDFGTPKMNELLEEKLRLARSNAASADNMEVDPLSYSFFSSALVEDELEEIKRKSEPTEREEGDVKKSRP